MTGIERVQRLLDAHGWGGRIRTLDDSTHTAQQAAHALGVETAQIAKSIVFKATPSGRPVVVVTRGDRRIDEQQLADWLKEAVARADPEWVRERTGYPIGGVSPLGHGQETILILDQALWHYGLVYAAAGHPRTIFAASPDELRELTGGTMVDQISV